MKNQKLEVGMKIKQVKEMNEYGFNHVGKEFEVTKVTEDIVLFKGIFGQGGMSMGEFNIYFEVVEEKKVETLQKEYKFKENDTIKIINGLFRGIEGKIISEGLLEVDTYVIRVDDGNLLTIKTEDLELIQKKPLPVERFTRERTTTKNFLYQVTIRGRRTTVKLLDRGVKGSVYCHSEDKYDKEEGINRAFNKALVKKLQQEINQ